jgi:hypothetical protein
LFVAQSLVLFAISVLWWSQDNLRKRLGLTVQYYTPESGTDLYVKARELAMNARRSIVVVNACFESRGGGSENAEVAYYEALERWVGVPGRRLQRFLQIEEGGLQPSEVGTPDALANRLASGYEKAFLRHVGRLCTIRDKRLEPRGSNLNEGGNDGGEVHVFLSSKLRQSTFVLYDDDHLLWAILEGDATRQDTKLNLAGYFVIRDPDFEVIPHFASAVRRINSFSRRLETTVVSQALT